MPSVSAISATREPIAPRPTTPSVFTGEFAALELLLVGFQGFIQLRSILLVGKRMDILDALHDAARAQQQSGGDEFLYRIGVGSR